MATLTADEEVASALEASARRAQLRAGHAAAATRVRARGGAEPPTRTAQRPPTDCSSQRLRDAGDPDRARMLVARTTMPKRMASCSWHCCSCSGMIEARSGNVPEAVNRLTEAAKASTEPSLTLEMLLEAAEAASFSGELAKVAELGSWAAGIPPQTERDRFHRGDTQWICVCVLRRLPGVPLSVSLTLLALRRNCEDPRALIWASNAAAVSGNLGDGLPYSTQAVDLARRQGLLSLLPLALQQHAMVLIALSRFDLAYAMAEEGYRLAEEVGRELAGISPTWRRSRPCGGVTRKRAHTRSRCGRLVSEAATLFLRCVAEWTFGMHRALRGASRRGRGAPPPGHGRDGLGAPGDVPFGRPGRRGGRGSDWPRSRSRSTA